MGKIESHSLYKNFRGCKKKTEAEWQESIGFLMDYKQGRIDALKAGRAELNRKLPELKAIMEERARQLVDEAARSMAGELGAGVPSSSLSRLPPGSPETSDNPYDSDY
ncbi:hypothetical protein HY008_02955 [Candidatus Woesebacteria bacterium]|nr:hypothetical protein [Candidatus Woesebacteria bacterium]